MLKTILLNRENVIIDIVETLKPVMKNVNGLTVLCKDEVAQGYLGSDETVYAKDGMQFISNYTDIFSTAMIDEDNIPSEVEPLKYMYVDGEFQINPNPYPKSNLSLTEGEAQNTADIQYVAMMTDVDLGG